MANLAILLGIWKSTGTQEGIETKKHEKKKEHKKRQKRKNEEVGKAKTKCIKMKNSSGKMSSAAYFIKCSVYWWLVSYEFCLELVKMFTCRISSLWTKLSSHFLPGNAEDACSEKYVDGLLHKTGENYEWPIDAQGNTSRGSLGHPEVSCKPECFFLCNVPVWSWIALNQDLWGHYSNLDDKTGLSKNKN